MSPGSSLLYVNALVFRLLRDGGRSLKHFLFFSFYLVKCNVYIESNIPQCSLAQLWDWAGHIDITAGPVQKRWWRAKMDHTYAFHPHEESRYNVIWKRLFYSGSELKKTVGWWFRAKRADYHQPRIIPAFDHKTLQRVSATSLVMISPQTLFTQFNLFKPGIHCPHWNYYYRRYMCVHIS